MKASIFLLITLVTTTFAAMAIPPVEEGKSIFNSRCASCHNIHKDLTGPALAGVHERRSLDWIVNFVHSSQTLIKKGDKDAVALYEKFNKIPMPDHPDLTDENIKNVVEYIKSESKAEATETPIAEETKLRSSYFLFSAGNYGFMLAFLALVALLIASVLFLVQVKAMQRNAKQNQW